MKKHKIILLSSNNAEKLQTLAQKHLDSIEEDSTSTLVSTQYSHALGLPSGFNYSMCIHYTKHVNS